MKVQIVVGTRPNFIKITQFPKLLKQKGIDFQIVHTGQHSQANMSDVFFKQFSIEPDVCLEVSQGTAAQKIANTMLKLELAIESYQPNLIITPGDVNSTLATALVANKMGVKLAHLESGLRSDDRTMPEEINRIITDELADICFVTEQSGIDNLQNAGKKSDQIFFVGNTMIDTLVAFEKEIGGSHVLEENKLEEDGYLLMTMHRPSNVDSKEGIDLIIHLIEQLCKFYKVVFPIHPRTRNNAVKFGKYEELEVIEGLLITKPMDYFSFQKLIKHAAVVITDSGGIQEETTFRQVPCLTLRQNTERPVTISEGTNQLSPFNVDEVLKVVQQIRSGKAKQGKIPQLWDGKATNRIVDQLIGLV